MCGKIYIIKSPFQPFLSIEFSDIKFICILHKHHQTWNFFARFVCGRSWKQRGIRVQGPKKALGIKEENHMYRGRWSIRKSRSL